MVLRCSPHVASGALAALLALGSPVWAQVTSAVEPRGLQVNDEADPQSWRQSLGRFRVGIMAGNRSALTARKMRPFRQAMALELNMPVELVFFSTEAALIAAHRRGRIEYGVFTATGFAVLNGLCKCGEALAAPTSQSGALGVTTILASRPGITRLTQLKGQTVVTGINGDLARQWVPGYGLEDEGLASATLGWNFRAEPSVSAALNMVVTGRAKAAFVSEQSVPNGLQTVWRSPVVRFGPHAVRRSLPADLKDRLSAWLVDLRETAPRSYDAIEPVHGGGFQPATNGDYVWLENALRFNRVLPVSREAGVLSALRR